MNSEGGNRPKRSNFKLAKEPFSLSPNDLIDPNAIYVITEEKTDSTQSSVRYLRFFENGRYLGNLKQETTQVRIEEINKVNASLEIGYYNVKNNKFLNLEYFRVKYGEGGFYDNLKGYVKNDSLFIFDTVKDFNNLLPPDNENCIIFIRKKIKGLSGTPDW